MNDHNLSELQTGPGQLADFLAELLKQFRHFSSPVEPTPEMATHLARIKIAARLLSVLLASSGPVTESFIRLGGVLQEWVAFFDASPESFPHHLTSPLERLANYLEEMMARHDQGVPATELADDEGWGGILASLRHAGTPLAVLEEVETLFRRWNRRWTDQNLTPLQEKQLLRRWLSLRKRGDVLFHRDGGHQAWAEDIPGPVGKSPEILLLVDSSFRRDQIRDKLTDSGFRVEIPCDPAQALEFLASGPAPQAILCDHLEPTRHLACVTEGLSRLPGAMNIPLVLVVGSSLAGPADQERAFSLGAVAAWREPFDPMDLKRILQRLSQP
jgi:CheY-like chemotaxis protein